MSDRYSSSVDEFRRTSIFKFLYHTSRVYFVIVKGSLLDVSGFMMDDI